MVIANSYEQRLYSTLSFKQFFQIRFARLYPLYILGTTITILTILLGVTDVGHKHFLLLTLLALFMLPKFVGDSQALYPFDTPTWSLFFELVGNLIYAGFIRFLSIRSLLLIIIASAIGLVFSISIYHLGLDIGWTIKTMLAGFFRVGYSFFFGILLFRLFSMGILDNILGINRYSIVALCGILGIVAAFLTATPAHEGLFDLFSVIVAFPPIIYLAMHIQPQGLWKRACKFLGTISYAVYVIHYPLGHLIEGLMKNKLHISVNSYAPFSGFVFILLLVFLCWFIDIIYDTPFRQFLLRNPFNSTSK